jgi:hypothetical protein
MVVATGFLCLQMYSFASSFRLAYVAAKADKESYSYGENVTFELRSLTPDVEFHIIGYELYGYLEAGVYVYPVREDYTPSQYLERLAEERYVSLTNPYGRVSFGNFSHNSQPLDLSWNGTLTDYSASQYFAAPPGYYLLFPKCCPDQSYARSSTVKAKLGPTSIFYYDGVEMEGAFSYDSTAHVVTALLGIHGLPAPERCDLNLSLGAMNQSGYSTATKEQTVDLVPKAWTNTSLNLSVWLDDFESAYLQATLHTSHGDLKFYLEGWLDQGVWTLVRRYY